MKKISVLILFVCLVFAGNEARCTVQNGEIWHEISLTIPPGDHLKKITYFSGNKSIYVITGTSIYVSEDHGMSWVEMDFPETDPGLKDIFSSDDMVYVISEKGIYRSTGEGAWGLAARGSALREGICDKDHTDKVFVRGANGVFRLEGGRLVKVDLPGVAKKVDAICCSAGTLWIGSGNRIYYSEDLGRGWKGILLTGCAYYDEDENGSGEEEAADISEGAETIPFIRDIYPADDRIIVTGQKGVFLFGYDGGIEGMVSFAGLGKSRGKISMITPSGLVSAGEKQVFCDFNTDPPGWDTVFEVSSPVEGAINDICMIAADKKEIWVVLDHRLFRSDVESLLRKTEPGRTPGPGPGYIGPLSAPSIREVHEMAMDFAEVNPEKIERWRRNIRLKAMLPKVSLGFSESSSDNIEIYKSSTKYYTIDGPRETDTDWDIDLSWDLSDLIWNESQASVDVRSKLMVQLRNDILEEVTRLYFERKRLLLEYWNTREDERSSPREKAARIEEITAYIDAFTGGRFSEAVECAR